MQVRRRALAGLATLVAVEVAAVALLVRLGTTHPFDLGPSLDAWSGAAPEDALAAALRWVALVAAGWLLVTTLVDVVTVACTRGRDVAGAHAPGPPLRVAPRVVRGLVDRALVAGMAVGVTIAPGAAYAQRAREPVPPVVTVVRDGRSGGLASLPADPGRAAGRPAPRTPVARTPPAPPAPPLVAPETPLTPSPSPTGVVVEPGDSLWEIAAREVARATGRARHEVPDTDVAWYWVAVCEANASHLSSGDADVVHVGEVVVLPPLA